MFQSHSVLRRYTPPTCTLEITAANSPLSRWAGQPVLKNVQFQLSLDDPKLPEQQWITLQGDRVQLEALSEAVTTYIQDFLQASHERLTHEPSPFHEASNVVTFTAPLSPTATPTHSTNSAGISLQPGSLLSHKLILGTLATSESGSTVSLSTLQLFDLANALDEYSTDVLSLPTLPRSRWLQPSPAWGQVAAVLLLAVGLSTSAIKLLDRSPTATSSAPTSSQGASSNDQRIATQLPPAVADKATPPVASGQSLPSPPPATSPSAKPGATVTMPKMPGASPSPTGQIPSGAIATYPVPPTVPGAPTIIPGESASSSNEQNTARSQPPKAPAAIAARPADSQFSAPTDANQRSASRGRSAKDSSDVANQAGSTAFDTIPQIAEARSYFQQRWKPPEGLTQILEYSLQIDANGTIQSITPLKQASADYIDRTSMPLIGEPFVSPIKSGRTAKIRLVLEPDGRVQTFQE